MYLWGLCDLGSDWRKVKGIWHLQKGPETKKQTVEWLQIWPETTPLILCLHILPSFLEGIMYINRSIDPSANMSVVKKIKIRAHISSSIPRAVVWWYVLHMVEGVLKLSFKSVSEL